MLVLNLVKITKVRFFGSHKILIGVLGLLIVTGLIILFFSKILITLPFKDSFIQVNTHRGFNVFFPRDKNSLFYFSNSLSPQVITGANTSYKGMEGLPYFQIDLPFKLPGVPQYSLPDQFAKLPASEIIKTTEKMSIPNSTSKTNSITAKEVNITFTFPPAYYLEYKPKSSGNPETININNRPQGLKDNWMSIQLFESQNCSPNSIEIYYRTPTKTITVANKWSMVIAKSDGRYGSRDQKGLACLDNNKTLMMYRYVKEDGNQAETDFDKILETAVYRP